jgi:hypothetical protein
MQHVDECKTEVSAKTFVLADELLARLKAWKQASQFRGAGDWVFASPVQFGNLPYSYTGVKQELARASEAAGVGHVPPTLSDIPTALGLMLCGLQFPYSRR